jgi:glycosyltransferase involved in cell wall biosynthesis
MSIAARKAKSRLSSKREEELPKRILVNVMLFGPGGGATHLLHLCKALVQEGAEITLLSRYAHESTPLVQLRDEIPIRFISTPFARNRRFYRLSTAWALLFWPLLLGGKKFDVLYTWELSPFTRFLSRFVLPEGRILLQRIGEPLEEGTVFDPALESLLDGMLVETSMQAEAARRGLTQKTSVLTLPLIGHCISPPERNGHHPKEAFQITFLGRYHRDKGIYRLLEILPGLKIGKAELNFHAWGPEREQFKKSLCDLGLEDRVHVNDAYTTPEELSAILARTDLVVLPSETEGLPVVLLEAMAHGVPFVATDVGATRVLAEENPDVRVVPLDNRALGQAIEEMAGAIRCGSVRSDRLQAYYQSRYGYEKLSRRWIDALLRPEQVWEREQALTESEVHAPIVQKDASTATR